MEKEFCCGDPVAYWKVVNAKGEVECFFKKQLNADAFVIASGASHLYKIVPIWEDQCNSWPEEFMD